MKSFYHIVKNPDSTVDIFLVGDQLRVLRGIVPDSELEEDLRRRFYDYYHDAEVIPWPS